MILLFFGSYLCASDTDRIIIAGDFSSNSLKGWEENEFVSGNVYQLVLRDGMYVLLAESSASASGLVKKVKIDIREYPYLNWSWRVESGLPGIDEKSKEGDDFAARIYVLSNEVLFWNTKVLNYVWSGGSLLGDSWPNAFAPDNSMMVAVRDSSHEIGTWYTEKRNVYEDFKRYYGKEVKQIGAVALMTDTDNSGGKAASYYGDVYFSKE